MKRLNILLLLTIMINSNSNAESLAEKLGYSATDKLLIVNADDTGMCHAANLAVMDGLEKGGLTSSTIMVPCPWFEEIANYAKNHPEADFGVHLTHTCEWKHYKWGPVLPKDKVPGLLDEQGYFWPDVEPIYEHATPDQALAEARAQIQKALDAGIAITHIDSHMGTLQLSLDYVPIYLQLAKEFDLPLRMASQSTLEKYGAAQLREVVKSNGLLCPDYLVYEQLQNYSADEKVFWSDILKNLQPGVTEIYIHPALPNDELRAITNRWKTRAMEYELFVNDPEIKTLLKSENVILIGYRPLLELQRSNDFNVKE